MLIAKLGCLVDFFVLNYGVGESHKKIVALHLGRVAVELSLGKLADEQDIFGLFADLVHKLVDLGIDGLGRSVRHK